MHLRPASVVCAGGPLHHPEFEMAADKTAGPRSHGEPPVANRGCHRARTALRGAAEIHPAAVNAQGRAAEILKRPTHGFVQWMRQRPHFGSEGLPPPPDSTAAAAVHQHALADGLPVPKPDLGCGMVPETVRDTRKALVIASPTLPPQSAAPAAKGQERRACSGPVWPLRHRRARPRALPSATGHHHHLRHRPPDCPAWRTFAVPDHK
jgi:hypothetical protein